MFQQEGIEKQSTVKRNKQVILSHVPCVIKNTVLGFLSTLRTVPKLLLRIRSAHLQILGSPIADAC